MKPYAQRKTQSVSALLSAVALGLFLEGCGGSSPSPASSSPASPPPVSLPPVSLPPTPVSVSANPVLSTEAAEAFTGIEDQDNGVSYANAAEGVTADLQTPANNRGSSAEGDTYTNIEDLTGSRNDDRLKGDDKDNRLTGLAGDDTLEGNGGDDILEGGEGEDAVIFRAGDGHDTMQGENDGGKLFFKDVADLRAFSFAHESGGDVVISAGGDKVTIVAASYAHGRYSLCYGADDRSAGNLYIGTPEKDAPLGGSSEADWVLGLEDDDRLFGEGGADILYGNAGDDILRGGEGNDILEGGAGVDTYVFQAGDGHDTIQGDTDNSRLYFENAVGYSSFLIRREQNGDVVIEVGSDSVAIRGGAYANDRYDLHYGSGNRALGRLSLGTTGDDEEIAGTEEADWILGFFGADTLRGGGGGDRLLGGGSNDFLYGGADDDVLYGGRGDDEIYGEAGDDRLYGNPGDDKFYGGGGKNFFEGGAGADSFFSGTGSNTVSYQDSPEGVVVTLVDADGQRGGYAADDIIELGAASGILGSRHGDELTGDGEANTLEGGRGADTLQGGASTDTYIFRVGDGADIVADLAGDTILLRLRGSSSFSYSEGDFTTSTVRKVGNDLVIGVDKNGNDGIEDKITVLDVYGGGLGVGTGNAAFTIDIVYDNGDAETTLTNDFWHHFG